MRTIWFYIVTCPEDSGHTARALDRRLKYPRSSRVGAPPRSQRRGRICAPSSLFQRLAQWRFRFACPSISHEL